MGMHPSPDQFTIRQDKKPDIQKKAKTLSDDIGELIDLYYKLSIVTVTEKATNAISAGLSGLIIIFFSMFTLLFAGIALGWFLGEKLNSMMVGYLIVAGIFALFIIITLALRKNHIFPTIRDIIIKKMYE